MATDVVSSNRIEKRPEFADILRDDHSYGTGAEVASAADRFNGWFDRLMIQSGVSIAPAVLVLFCLLASVALGGAAFIIQEHLLSTAVASAIGGILPIAVLISLRSHRQMQMLRQMPGMVGELARAARTGRSLPQCFALVAQDTQEPLGPELKLCTRKMQMGLTLSEALKGLPERTGMISLNVLVTALSVHEQTGGDLVRVLERLSRTIRDRLTFLGRLRTATTASRATAILMIALPPGILAFFIFRDPEYFSNLMNSAWGRNSTLLALLLQIVGSVWILRILKNSQRT